MDTILGAQAHKVTDPTTALVLADPSAIPPMSPQSPTLPSDTNSALAAEGVIEDEEELSAESKALERERLARTKKNANKKARKIAKRAENAEAAKQLKALTGGKLALVNTNVAKGEIEEIFAVEKAEAMAGSRSPVTSVRMMTFDPPSSLAICFVTSTVTAHQEKASDKSTSTGTNGVKSLSDELKDVKCTFNERVIELKEENNEIQRALAEAHTRVSKEMEDHKETAELLIEALTDNISIEEELRLSEKTVEDLDKKLRASQARRLEDITTFEKRSEAQIMKINEFDAKNYHLVEQLSVRTQELETCKKQLEAEKSKIFGLSDRLDAIDRSSEHVSGLQQQFEEQTQVLDKCKADMEVKKAEKLDFSNGVQCNGEKVANLLKQVDDQSQALKICSDELKEEKAVRIAVTDELTSSRKVEKLASKARIASILVTCLAVASYFIGSACPSSGAQFITQTRQTYTFNDPLPTITITKTCFRAAALRASDIAFPTQTSLDIVSAAITEVDLSTQTSLATLSTAIPDEFWIAIQNSLAVNINTSISNGEDTKNSTDTDTCPLDALPHLRDIPTGPLLRKVAIVVGVPLVITVAAISFCWL
ncbi:hypothetical protein BKA61DRAFT_684435 [Leptodontidium sp. MPI-SDFR-AT-0119]|nr:hypothetical protein BKA61DRAFT_684435 [Leptodontidium sp. MPI-SDFR-AT-0119]